MALSISSGSLPARHQRYWAYGFRLNKDMWGAPVMSIRSPGADGIVEGTLYETDSLPGDDLNRNISWSDGQYYQSPIGEQTLVFTDNFESATTWRAWSCGPGH
jgi:hypothetical protein